MTTPPTATARGGEMTEIEHLRWQLTRAKSALENWGRHHPWCAALKGVNGAGQPCDCGFADALADATPVAVANSVGGVNTLSDTSPEQENRHE